MWAVFRAGAGNRPSNWMRKNALFQQVENQFFVFHSGNRETSTLAAREVSGPHREGDEPKPMMHGVPVGFPVGFQGPGVPVTVRFTCGGASADN